MYSCLFFNTEVQYGNINFSVLTTLIVCLNLLTLAVKVQINLTFARLH